MQRHCSTASNRSLLRIGTLGNSITYGARAKGTPWPRLLERSLSQRLAHDARVEVHNLAVRASSADFAALAIVMDQLGIERKEKQYAISSFRQDE